MRLAGAADLGDGKAHLHLPFPWIVTHVYGIASTAPSGGAVTIDIERSDSTGWNSIFTAPKNIIADGKKTGFVTPDGTYEFRCVPGTLTAASTDLSNGDDAIVRLNLDARNGALDIAVDIGFRSYVPALERYMAYDDLAG